jgi:hypothetical protein
VTFNRTNGHVLFAIVFSCALAYAIPYDVLFDRATLNLPAARAIAMLCFWIGGLWLQRANGFSLAPVDMRYPALQIAGAALAVAIWCVVMDAVVFRSILPPGYYGSEQQPLGLRLLYYCSRAFNENVLYRLFLGSLFAYALRKLLPQPKFAVALAMLGMAAAHLINVLANMGYAGFAPETCLWLLLRFMVPGIAWSWLYVRHGFVANEGAAMGVHCFLQPMVSIAF